MAGNIFCKASGDGWNVRNTLFDLIVGFAFEKFFNKSRAPNLTKKLEDDLGYFLRTGWPEKYKVNLGGSYRVVVLDDFPAGELMVFRDALSAVVHAFRHDKVSDDIGAVPEYFEQLARLTGELIDVVESVIRSKKEEL